MSLLRDLVGATTWYAPHVLTPQLLNGFMCCCSNCSSCLEHDVHVSQHVQLSLQRGQPGFTGIFKWHVNIASLSVEVWIGSLLLDMWHIIWAAALYKARLQLCMSAHRGRRGGLKNSMS